MSLWVKSHIYHLNPIVEKLWKDTLHQASLNLTKTLIKHYATVIKTKHETLDTIKTDFFFKYLTKLTGTPSGNRAKLVAFGGHRMDSLGKAIILCEHKNKYSAVEFEVLSKVSNVLGLKTSTQLKLVKRIETVTNDPLREYADTFSGLGCITDVTHHIKTDPTCKPVVHPPRKVPVTIRAKVKEELARMEQLGVVERIRELTDWVNSMVTVMKPNGN